MGEEWRTLTFGDLRPGDVIRTDQDGPEKTVRSSRPSPQEPRFFQRVLIGQYAAITRRKSDPVLVRHPRPQGDKS